MTVRNFETTRRHRLKQCLLFFAMALLSSAVAARDWYVATDGSDTGTDGTIYLPYRTITNAVRAASAGDTIRVKGGLYEENVIDSSVNDLTILGGYCGDEWDRDLRNAQTFVRAASSGSPVVTLSGTVEGVRLGGLVLCGGTYGIQASRMAGMVFEQLVISNCTQYAIQVSEPKTDKDRRMIVASCLLTDNKGGFQAPQSGCGWNMPYYFEVLGCTFLNTGRSSWGASGYGPEWDDFYGVRLFRNNIFVRVNGLDAVQLDDGRQYYTASYYNNCMAYGLKVDQYTTKGVPVEEWHPSTVTGYSGNIYDAYAGLNADGSLKDDSPCLKAGDDLSTNENYAVTSDLYGTPWSGRYDMGCIKSSHEPHSPCDIHVAATGSDTTGDGTAAQPYATLGKAIDAFKYRDRILVRGGNYTENVANSTKDDLVVLGSYDANWQRDLKNSRTVISAADAASPVLALGAVARNRWSGVDLAGGSDGLSVPNIRHHVFEQMKITGNAAAGVAWVDASGDPAFMSLSFANLLVAENGTYAIRRTGYGWGDLNIYWYGCTFAANASGTFTGYRDHHFWNCICHNPAAATEFTGQYASLSICACCVRDGLFGDCPKTVLAEPETLTVDPLLDGEYRLTSESLCNKRGDDLSAVELSVATQDIEGVAWDGTGYDMGCFSSEYPYVPGEVLLANVYVSTDGDDGNDGSAEHPVATLSRGLALTDAGGTCHVAAGVYAAGGDIVRDGITLAGAGRDRTIVTGSGVTVGAHNATVSDIAFRQCGSFGVKVTGDGVATNAIIRNCICTGCSNGIDAYLGSSEQRSVPVTLHHVICTNNTSRGVYAWCDLLAYDSLFADNGNDTTGDGIYVYEGGFRLYNCTIADNPVNALNCFNWWNNYAHQHAVNCIFTGSAMGLYHRSTLTIGVFSNCLFNCTADFVTTSVVESACLHGVAPRFKMKPSAPYLLAVGSQGRMAGIDLSNLTETAPGIVRDVDGIFRRGRWDMGCYRNVSSGLSVIVR